MAYDDILEALQAIAARCDGATARDGCGFNRQDSGQGRYLAACPTLNQNEAIIGYQILRKYKEQLMASRIDYRDLKDPDTVTVGIMEVLRETDAALLVLTEDGEELWMPLSQVILSESEVTEVGDSGDLVITRWIAEKKGLI